MRLIRGAVALLLALMIPHPGTAATPSVAAAEAAYADWRDARHALDTLAAGSLARVAGLDAASWRRKLTHARQALDQALPATAVSAEDARALGLMRADVAAATTDAPLLSAGAGSEQGCATARSAQGEPALVASLYDCFATFGNHIDFEGRRYSRTGALALLHELPEASRRETLFRAFAPLWSAVHDGRDSPYQRLLGEIVAHRGADGDRIDAAARTVGADRHAVEQWLRQALEAWSKATDTGTLTEPWDYWYRHTAATRAVDALLPPDRVPRVADRFLHDLGADLASMQVLQDLNVRPGKAPLAYTDYIRIGRHTARGWQPARVRVSANLDKGGLYVANELIHEDGHAVHMMALRTRPAFFDLGDAVYYEALADVPAWSVAAPDFQRRYLGTVLDRGPSNEALFAGVALDLAWGLFELQMLDHPDTDPNQLWAALTERYLHIRPHPELSWWALRVQLVHVPGYMINYALGAVITADLREQIVEEIGPFDAGNRRWYPWLSKHLLAGGETRPTQEMLEQFLGRPVTPQALIEALQVQQVQSSNGIARTNRHRAEFKLR